MECTRISVSEKDLPVGNSLLHSSQVLRTVCKSVTWLANELSSKNPWLHNLQVLMLAIADIQVIICLFFVILTSINPKKDNRLFVEHVVNVVYVKLFWMSKQKQFDVHSMYWTCNPTNTQLSYWGTLTDTSDLTQNIAFFRLFPIISISQKFFSIFFLTLENIGIDEKVICYHNISN